MKTFYAIVTNSMLFLLLILSFTSTAQESAFQADTISKLNKQFEHQQWLMVLWSLECPPCFKELALISEFTKQHNDLAIVIVNADDDENISEERQDVIKQFELEHLQQYYFSEGSASTNRYQIDKHWHGELPRSYFIDEQGQFHGKSGVLLSEHIQQWLLN